MRKYPTSWTTAQTKPTTQWTAAVKTATKWTVNNQKNPTRWDTGAYGTVIGYGLIGDGTIGTP